MHSDLIEQFEKHAFSICINCDSLSNVKLTILALLNDDRPKLSTERGKQIDRSPHPEKHISSTFFNFDSPSNPMCSTFAFAKHDFPRNSIEFGMTIDFNLLNPKQKSPSRISRHGVSNRTSLNRLSQNAPRRTNSLLDGIVQIPNPTYPITLQSLVNSKQFPSVE
jgi:hypothetical protein